MDDPINEDPGAVFTNLVELASEEFGGKVLEVSDDFFAEKENLLKPGRGVFKPGKFTDRGKWMDGWESRRRRTPGYDWCVIRLGLPGKIKAFDIDTNHFLGNHPPYASVEGIWADQNKEQQIFSDNAGWQELLERSPLAPGSQNLFSISGDSAFTHLRLKIYPDGGVARFRAYGEVFANVDDKKQTDLIALENGGKAIACSDMFFSPMINLIKPGKAPNMGDGWESRRRRGPGNDWVILKAGVAGHIKSILVDTSHFKGNYPDQCSIDGCNAGGHTIDEMNQHEFDWEPVMEPQKLKPHEKHHFEREVIRHGPYSHFRLNIFPDGGVSRLRIYGDPAV